MFRGSIESNHANSPKVLWSQTPVSWIVSIFHYIFHFYKKMFFNFIEKNKIANSRKIDRLEYIRTIFLNFHELFTNFWWIFSLCLVLLEWFFVILCEMLESILGRYSGKSTKIPLGIAIFHFDESKKIYDGGICVTQWKLWMKIRKNYRNLLYSVNLN